MILLKKLLSIVLDVQKIFYDERATTLSVTYSFSPNTLIVSSQVNQNFTDIETVVNALTADNYSDNSVTAAKFNADVVRTNYGLKQHTDGSLMLDVSDTNPCLEVNADGGVRVIVDDVTIERSADGIRVKALGIDTEQLAANCVENDKVADNAIAGENIQLASEDEGDVMFCDGTDWTRLPRGSAYQVLTMKADLTAPEWATRPRLVTGTYSGDGNASKAISGLGGQPKLLRIHPQVDNSGTYYECVKTDQDGTKASYHATNQHHYEDDLIISLDTDGFTVGDGSSGMGNVMNYSGNTYTYSAWVV